MNMELWNSVASVPAEYVKDQEINGTRLKGVNPHYMVQMATEKWGPIGTGWGIAHLSWQVVDGTLIMGGDLWYNSDPKTGFRVYVDVPFQQGRDCLKRAQTMLQSKALSKLGFAAEVYLGMWDESEFAEAKQKEAASRAKARAAAKAIDSAATLEALDKLQATIHQRVADGALTEGDKIALDSLVAVRRKKLEVHKG